MSETLRQKQSRHVVYVGKLIFFAIQNGFELTWGDAFRSKEQARWNAEHGLGIANSLHTKRLAVDFNIFLDGAFLDTVRETEPLGAYWESLAPDCRWGGRFRNLDIYHFSIEHNGVR